MHKQKWNIDQTLISTWVTATISCKERTCLAKNLLQLTQEYPRYPTQSVLRQTDKTNCHRMAFTLVGGNSKQNGVKSFLKSPRNSFLLASYNIFKLRNIWGLFSIPGRSCGNSYFSAQFFRWPPAEKNLWTSQKYFG